MEALTPTETASLFRPLLVELVAMLRTLGAADWERPTLAPRWRVRDVAAHLLDGDLRKIAVYRDDHVLPQDHPVASGQDLARFVNGLNATGVAFAARLSPRVITDLLEITGGWVADLLASLPPAAPARFPVSWAGETESSNWMDIGREYTERWHHQAQIRDAVGAPLLLAPRWMEPLLDISVRALPHAYAGISAVPGTAITLIVEGETSGTWTVLRNEARWQVVRGAPSRPAAVVQAPADKIWRLLYNALPEEQSRELLRVEGDAELTAPLLRARSVIV